MYSANTIATPVEAFDFANVMFSDPKPIIMEKNPKEFRTFLSMRNPDGSIGI